VFSDRRENVERQATCCRQIARCEVDVAVHKVCDELDITREATELSDHEQRMRRSSSSKCIAQDRPIGMPAAFDL
jgi:hypothetical protein